jgi:peroxiredoxin (alkyl hydroperoxide reductase subunit C)|tara:strand:+ start:5957 stop:6721 length:765 start_codon:yes stop_codon:yes gene_type:complete
MIKLPKGFTTDPHFNAIGSKAPNFRAWGVVYLKKKERRGYKKPITYKHYARRGRFELKDYWKKKNVVLIFFPYNLDFDGNIQILAFNNRYSEFRALNTEILGIGHDFCYAKRFNMSVTQKLGGFKGIKFPILSDIWRTISLGYGIIGTNYKTAQHSIFVIDKFGTIRHAAIYDARIGANVNEILRILRAIQYLYRRPLRVCPPQWEPGRGTGKLGSIYKSDAYFGYLERLNRRPRPAKYDTYLDKLTRQTKNKK